MIIIIITAAGTVITHPISFLGEMIFSGGDTQLISKEIKETYQQFLSSDLGIECLNYIGQLSMDHTSIYYHSEYYLVPSMIALDTGKQEDKQMSLESSGIKPLIKKAYQLRQSNENDYDYIQALKNETLFKKITQLSDTTLLLYMTELSGRSLISSDELPTCTADLQLIASSEIYIGNSNPFVASGYRGQCTWWAWSRCKETTGIIMPTGNARDWHATTSLNMGKEPRSKCVLDMWDNGLGKQHVIFIENFENGIITFSEGNIGNNGSDEYTNIHYLELLRYGRVDYETFFNTRIAAYDNYIYIYTN